MPDNPIEFYDQIERDETHNIIYILEVDFDDQDNWMFLRRGPEAFTRDQALEVLRNYVRDVGQDGELGRNFEIRVITEITSQSKVRGIKYL